MAMNPRLLRPLARFQAPASFTPASITGLIGWWDASNVSSVTLNDGNVSVLADLSNSGNDIGQATAALQPPHTASVQNGLHAMSYDGSRALYGAVELSGASFTVFCVSQVSNSGGSYKRTVVLWNSGDATDFTTANSAIPICHSTGDGTLAFHNSLNTTPISFAFDAPLVTYCAADDSEIEVWENGSSVLAGFGLSTTFSPEQFWLGNSPTANDGAFAGWIGETILYDRKLNQSELAQVVEYLQSKWAIA